MFFYWGLLYNHRKNDREILELEIEKIENTKYFYTVNYVGRVPAKWYKYFNVY